MPTRSGLSASSATSVSTGCSSSAAATSNTVLRTYIQHYNQERPHRGLALNPPEPPEIELSGGDVRRRDRLGGLVHEYYRAAP
jgi:hypothetical protein